MQKCSGIKASGERCRNRPTTGSEYCPAHDPARADARRESASKAGKSKNPNTELVEVKAELRKLARDVLSGKVSTAKGSVAGQILGIFLRAVEQQRKQREVEELQREVAEIRELLDARQDPRESYYG